MKQTVAGDKTACDTKRHDFAPGRTTSTVEREATGRLEVNQIAEQLGATSDLSLSFMAVLAAHMPPMKRRIFGTLENEICPLPGGLCPQTGTRSLGGASVGCRQIFAFSAGLRSGFLKISRRARQRVNPRHLG